MRATRHLTSCLCALGLILLSPGKVFAQQRGPFDGTWNVILTCAGAYDGAAGYTYRFLASVQDGRLHGETGVPGQAGSFSLDGPIQPDGNAMLIGRGLTNAPVYSVGRVPPLSPYSYHLQSQFQGTHGTGKRLEVRPCEAVFTKL